MVSAAILTLILISLATVSGSIIYDALYSKLITLNNFANEKNEEFKELISNIDNKDVIRLTDDNINIQGIILNNKLLIHIENDSDKIIDSININANRNIEYKDLDIRPAEEYMLFTNIQPTNNIDIEILFNNGESKIRELDIIRL